MFRDVVGESVGGAGRTSLTDPMHGSGAPCSGEVELPSGSVVTAVTSDIELFHDEGELEWLMAQCELTALEVRELRAAGWL